MTAGRFEEPLAPRRAAVETGAEDEVVRVVPADGRGDDAEVGVGGVAEEILAILLGDVLCGGLLTVALLEPGAGGLVAGIVAFELEVVLSSSAFHGSSLSVKCPSSQGSSLVAASCRACWSQNVGESGSKMKGHPPGYPVWPGF